MAVRTTGSNTSVIHRRAFERGRGFMAALARSRGRDMSTRFANRGHACKSTAVVASSAASGDARMVHGRA